MRFLSEGQIYDNLTFEYIPIRWEHSVIRLYSNLVGIPAITRAIVPANVGYSRIVEKEFDKNLSLKRSIVSEYDATAADEPLFSLFIMHDSLCGSLLKRSILSPQNDTIRSVDYNYNVYPHGDIRCNAYLLDNYYIYDTSLWHHRYPRYCTQIYSYPRHWKRLESEILREYADGSIMQTTTSYVYNSSNKKVSQQTVTEPSGQMRTTYHYPSEFGGLYSTMANSHNFMDGVCIETRMYETRRGSEQMVGKKKQGYSFHPADMMPFQPTTFYNSLGTEPLVERLKVKFDTDSGSGNPIEIVKDNAEKQTILWSYGKRYPVATIVGASHAEVSDWIGSSFINNLANATSASTISSMLASLRSTLSDKDVLVTTYEHKPLVGLLKVVQPNGDVLHYEYDSFNRLYTIKDQDGNIIESYTYNYAQSQN